MEEIKPRTAVSREEYGEYGCVNCGCGFCYTGSFHTGQVAQVTCAECETTFVIMADGLTKSPVGFGMGRKDRHGNPLYEYPTVSVHPRKGIAKHKFVRPDVRPENMIGEFCSPRGVGYDLACFVKSKQAGERVVAMFDQLKDDKKVCFDCWLDYREHEPLWIQVKIKYANKERAQVLADLIKANGDIITIDTIKDAMDMKLEFSEAFMEEVQKVKSLGVHPLSK